MIAASRAPTCQVNAADPAERTYEPCGKPAEWYVEAGHGHARDAQGFGPPGYHACEQHARDALLDDADVTAADGGPARLCTWDGPEHAQHLVCAGGA